MGSVYTSLARHNDTDSLPITSKHCTKKRGGKTSALILLYRFRSFSCTPISTKRSATWA